MDTQIEQLNLSSITKFALAYAGITTVSELKEYNYISLANVLPRNCSLNPIMKELNTYGYIFPPENEIPISSIPMSKRLYNILDRNNILYISQLTHYAREEIMQFRNLGSTTLIELDALCQKYHVKINSLATVYKGNIIKNLIMDCQSYTKYRPNETTGGIFVSWRRKEELPTGA